MTSPTLGSVSFEIGPDVNLARFRSQGVAAAAAFGRAFEGGTKAALSGLSLLGGAAVVAGTGVVKGLGLASKGLLDLSRIISSTSYQLRALGGTLSTFVTGPLVAAGVGLASWGLSTATRIEDAEVALKALLPPGYDVEALFKRLSDLAIKSPVFSIDALSTFTKTLIGAGVSADQTETILRSLDKTFTVFGVTGDRAELVLRAIGQTFSKGKVTAEELTQQIGEQIPIWGLLAQAAGMTVPELQALQADGDLTVEMFGELLGQMGSIPSIAAGAAAGVNTLSARFSIMKEALQQALALGFLEVFPQIKEQLDRLQPVLTEFTVFLVKQIPLLIDAFTDLVDKLFELRQQFDALAPGTQKFLLQMALIAPVVGPALLILGTLGTTLSSLLAMMSFAINPTTLLFAALAYGIQHLWKTSAEFRDNVIGFRDAFVGAFMKALPGAIVEFKDAVFNELIPALGSLGKALSFTTWEEFGRWLGETLPKLVVNAVHTLAAGIQMLADTISYLRAQWDGLSDSTQQMIIKMVMTAAVFAPLVPLLLALSPLIIGVGLALASVASLTLSVVLVAVKALAVAFGIVVSVVEAVASALVGLVGVLGFTGIAILAVSAAIGYGLYQAWKQSETFRESVLSFADGFRTAWGERIPAAIDSFVATVVEAFLPAIQHLAAAFGLNTWEKFSYWLGTLLPRALGFAIDTLARALEAISRVISLFAQKWAALDETTQENIKTMLKWAAATAAAIIIAEGLAAALFKVLGPWELLIVAAVAGGKFLFDTFSSVREGVDTVKAAVETFAASFVASWMREMPAALAAFKASVQTNIIDPLEALAASVGITSLQSFAAWFGNVLPVLLAGAVQRIAEAINLLGNIVRAVIGWWNGLSDTARENIKAMAEWALSTGALILAAEAIAGAIFSVIGPWELLIVGVTTGIKYFWETSATFREGILAFAKSFKASWEANVVPALKSLWAAIKDNLVPALLDLAHAFGLPEFKTFQDFMAWFGTQLPVLMAKGVERLKEGIDFISEKIRLLTDKWNGLDDSTQKTIEKIAGFGLLAAPFASSAASIAGSLAGLVVSNPELVALGLALVAIGVAAKFMWDNSEDFRNGVNAFKDTFKKTWGEEVPKAVDNFKKAFKENLQPALEEFARALGFTSLKDFGTYLGEVLPKLVADGINALGDSTKGLAKVIEWVTDHIKDIKNWWHNDLEPFLNGFAEGFGKMLGAVKEAAMNVWRAFNDNLKPALDNLLKSLGYSSWKDFGHDLGYILGFVAKAFFDMQALMINLAAGIIIVITKIIEAVTWLVRHFDEAWHWIAEGAVAAWNRVWATFTHLWSDIKAWWDSDVGHWIQDKASWIADRFVDGIKTIASWFEWLGKTFWEGLVAIGHGFEWLWDKLRGGAENTKNWFHDRVEDIKGFFHGLGDSAGNVADTIVDAFRNAAHKVVHFINSNVIDMANWAFDHIPGISYRIGHLDESFAQGGLVRGPGTTTSDSILARLSNREFVVNARATADYLPLLRAINAGIAPNVVMGKMPGLANATLGGDGAGLGQAPVYVTVLLDGEPIVVRAQAVVDANNQATVNLLRNGRGLR